MALAKGAIPSELLQKIGGEVSKMNEDPVPNEADDLSEAPADISGVEDSADDLISTIEQELEKPYKTLEEFEAEGRDPEFYMGKKAYEQNQNLLKQIKALKEKTKGKDADITALTEGIEEIRQKFAEDKQRELLRERTFWQRKMEESKREMLPEDFAKAKENLARVERQIGQNPVAKGVPQEPEPIVNFRKQTPMLDRTHPEYSEAYDTAVSARFNKMLAEFVRRNQRAMNEDEITTHLKSAVETINKELRIDSMRQSASAPPAPSSPRGRASSASSSDMPKAHRDLAEKWEREGKKTGNKQLIAQAKKLRSKYEK